MKQTPRRLRLHLPILIAALAFLLAPKGLAQVSLTDLAKEMGKAAARKDAIRDTEQDAIAAKMPAGLLGVKWLMSSRQVQELRPAAQQVGPDQLEESAEVYGHMADIHYNLQDDTLLLIIVNFLENQFDATQKALEADFGSLPKAEASDLFLRDSLKIKGRFAIRHTFRTYNGIPIEQIQLYRTTAEATRNAAAASAAKPAAGSATPAPDKVAGSQPAITATTEADAEATGGVKDRTAAWLERGLRSLLVVDKLRMKASKEDIQYGSQMVIWLNGWIAGTRTMALVSLGYHDTPPYLKPPEDWYDGAKVATSVLDFFGEYRDDINPKIPAWAVMVHWYQASHPEAPKRLTTSVRESLRKMGELAMKQKH